jgi:periplasmic protein TonB
MKKLAICNACKQTPRWTILACIATLFAGCAIKQPEVVQPPPPPKPAPPTQAPQKPVPPVIVDTGKISAATTPRDYRRDAAKHLYASNEGRVYPGKMPPLLYAVGVLEVEIDNRGRVIGTSWMRRPSHAPEVVAEIERAVRRASPFPAPTRMGRVTYTDTWLWDKSGRFQLDTLTEGQM